MVERRSQAHYQLHVRHRQGHGQNEVKTLSLTVILTGHGRGHWSKMFLLGRHPDTFSCELHFAYLVLWDQLCVFDLIFDSDF